MHESITCALLVLYLRFYDFPVTTFSPLIVLIKCSIKLLKDISHDSGLWLMILRRRPKHRITLEVEYFG
jgi:hypothetical protein